MKQYLLFAGRNDARAGGVHGLIGSFDTCAEAFVALVDQQILCEWWHVLDTKTGDVVERRHLRVHNGMIGFQRSDWLVVSPIRQEVAVAPPALPIAAPMPKAAELGGLEGGLRSVVTTGVKNGKTHSLGNGSAEH